jgi:3-dehydroquinate synthase
VSTLTVSLPPNLSHDSYPIHLEYGALRKLSSLIDLSAYSQVVVCTDTTVAPYWILPLSQGIQRAFTTISLEPGERHKNIATLQRLWEELAAVNADRKTVLINLGGGVIGDLGGFAASTYMRGIDFIQIPTTLLAQVDASIGGKTGIDLGGIKNLVGAFAPPRAVIIDPETLKSLPAREFRSGLAEIIKHGLINDRAYFECACASSHPDDATLLKLIEGSCAIKAAIVTADPTEKGMRKLLNFGHTLGHAVESLALESPHPLLHGEAIAIGMCLEARLSARVGLLSEDASEQITTAIARVGLPTEIPYTQSPEALIKRMSHDKKNSHGEIRWTLLKTLGEGVWDHTIPQEVVNDVIAASLKTSLHAQKDA